MTLSSERRDAPPEFALLEIDGTASTLAVGRRVGRRSVKVTRVESLRATTEDASETARQVGDTLRGLKVGPETPVHLALGERRFHHFLLRIPLISATELRAVALREARRLTSASNESAFRLGIRHLRAAGGAWHEFAVVAAETAWFDAVLEALRSAGLAIESTTSIEDATLAGLPEDCPPTFAAISRSGERLRYLHCQDGGIVQVRRLVAPDLDDPTMVTTHLAIEIPRTSEFLAQNGWRAATECILTADLGIDQELAKLLVNEDLTRVRTAPAPHVPTSSGAGAESSLPASLQGLTQRILERDRAWSLTNDFVPKYWRSKTWLARRVGGSAVILLGLAAALWSGYRWFVTGGDVARLRARLEHLTLGDPGNLEPLMDRDRVEREFSQNWRDRRRPVSRALADLIACATEGVYFAAIRLDAKQDRITVDGWCQTPSRRETLEKIAEVLASMRVLPMLRPAAENVTAVAGAPVGRLDFHVAMVWRGDA